MKIIIQVKDNSGDYPASRNYVFNKVWELQDNGSDKLVVKMPDHECILFEKKEILKLEVEKDGI